MTTVLFQYQHTPSPFLDMSSTEFCALHDGKGLSKEFLLENKVQIYNAQTDLIDEESRQAEQDRQGQLESVDRGQKIFSEVAVAIACQKCFSRGTVAAMEVLKTTLRNELIVSS
jgi:hypothetical protein